MPQFKRTAIAALAATAAAAASFGLAQAAVVTGGQTVFTISNQDGSLAQQFGGTVQDGGDFGGTVNMIDVNAGPDGDELLVTTTIALDAFLVVGDANNAGNLTALTIGLPVMDGFEIVGFQVLESAFDIVGGQIQSNAIRIIFEDMGVGMDGVETVLFRGRFAFAEVAPVPVPAAALLFAPALLGGIALRRRG